MVMRYMCDALLPTEQRLASLKYRRLAKRFNPWFSLPEENIEARAMLLTPGLLRYHVQALMMWDRNMVDILKPLEQLDDKAQPLAMENAMSASLEDGRAMLVTILGNFPDWSRSVPMWSTRYLQHCRKRGATAKALAYEFKTTTNRIFRWWGADLFDPLIGTPRPRASTWRGKPIVKGRLRVTV